MPDVSIFMLGSQSITVKDATARSQSQQAVTQAAEALQIAQEVEQLSRVTVSYEQDSETITITTTDHQAE